MGRTAKTATTETSLPLALQFLAAWVGMWVGENQAHVIQTSVLRTRRCASGSEVPAPTGGQRNVGAWRS